MKLSNSEIEHLLTLLYANEEDGSCYGRRDYWEKRTKNLIDKLEKELDERSMVLE